MQALGNNLFFDTSNAISVKGMMPHLLKAARVIC
jgi:hypothetical protein